MWSINMDYVGFTTSATNTLNFVDLRHIKQHWVEKPTLTDNFFGPQKAQE